MTALYHPNNVNTLASSLRGGLALIVISCAVFSASAGDKAPSEKVLKKFDLNKDGKLDEAETAKWNADKKAAAEKKKTAEGAAATPGAPTP